MQKRIFILVLALLVAFCMMPGLGFAATKIVKTSATTYDKEGGEWYVYKVDKYSYDTKAMETKKSEHFSYYDEDEDDYLDYTNVTTTTYTKKGNIKTVIRKKEDRGYTYKDVNVFSNGKLTKTNHYYKSNSSGSKYKKDGYTTYSFKSTKNTIKTYDNNGFLREKIVETKNSKGKITKRVINDKSFGITTTETYNSKGLLTKSVSVESGDGDSYIDTVKYTYDDYGRLIKEVYKWESSDSKGSYTHKHVYKGYYKKHKYPTKELIYKNDETKAYLKIINTYKTKKI